MDCIDLFKKAAAAMQTDPRYLELDAARRENDNDQELQGLIGEFNLKRLDLNNESAKPEPDTAHVADLNQQVNDLYTQIMSSEGMVRYNTAKKECEAMVSHIDAIINTAMNGGDPMTVQAPPGRPPGRFPPWGGLPLRQHSSQFVHEQNQECEEWQQTLCPKKLRMLIHRRFRP